MHARGGQSLGHRQQLQSGRGMHEDHQRPRGFAAGHIAHAFEIDRALRTREAVDLGELRSFGEANVNPFGVNHETVLR